MPENNRLVSLDALRGLAALYVLAFHCLLLVPHRYFENITGSTAFQSSTNLALYVVYHFFGHGHAAVLLFFVLSGYVLASSLTARSTSYVSFAIKRCFRIYPMFFVAILFSYGLHRLLSGHALPESTGWFHDLVATAPLTLDNLQNHLLMRGRMADWSLNGPIWSLVHEMRISLLFPFIYFLVCEIGAWSLAIALAVSAQCVFTSVFFFSSAPSGFYEKTDIASWFTTFYLIFAFVVGILLSLERERMSAWLARLSPLASYAVAVAVALGLLIPEGSVLSWRAALTDLTIILCAAGLIALAVGSPAVKSKLARPVLIGLGRISYSLYLLHIPIIYAVALLLLDPAKPVSVALVIGLSLALSLFLAVAARQTIELPFIALGRAVNNKWLRKPP